MNDFLKKIITERKRDELIKLNAIDIVNKIFSELHERERDVLSRRFALGYDEQHTLEEIGKLYNLTRERVRQIEKASLEKIKKLENLEERLVHVRSVIENMLNEHGGLMEREFLLDILSILTIESGNDNIDSVPKNHKNYFDFILSNLLSDYVEKVENSEKFTSFYKLKNNTIDYLEDLVDELKSQILSIKKTMKIDELLENIKNLKTFKNYKDKINKKIDSVDLTAIFKSKVFPEKGEIINENKILYSILQAIKDINRNKLGYWGHDSWPEIKPKRISDKIYLVLKEEERPMHFNELTKMINEIGFDHKKVNSGSVHNELIIDDRYVLVNRGVYGLKEWQK